MADNELEAKVTADTTDFNAKLNSIPKDADKAFTSAGKSVDKFNDKVKDVTESLNGQQKAFGAYKVTADPISAAATFAKQQADMAARHAAAEEKMAENIAASKAKLEEQAAAAGAATAAGSKLTSVLSGVGIVAGTVVVAGAAAAAAAFYQMTKLSIAATLQTAEYTNALHDMSHAVGINIESLSALDHAFRMSGMSVDEFQLIFVRLNDRIQDAASNTKSQAGRVFRELGIDVKQGADKVKPTLEVFLSITDALAKMGEGSKQTSLAFDLFSFRGYKLLSIINKGPGAIQELMTAAKEMGLVISGPLQKATEDYKNAQYTLNEEFRKLKIRVAEEMLPAFAAFLNGLVRLIESPAAQKVVDFWMKIVPPVADWVLRKMGDPIATLKGQVSDVAGELSRLEGLVAHAKKQREAGLKRPEEADPIIAMWEADIAKKKVELRVLEGTLAEKTNRPTVKGPVEDFSARGNELRTNTALEDRWKNAVDSARMALENKVEQLKAEAIAMQEGDEARLKYVLQQEKIDALDRAKRQDYPAKVIAGIAKAYDDMTPKIIAATKANRDLKYEVDKMAEAAKVIEDADKNYTTLQESEKAVTKGTAEIIRVNQSLGITISTVSQEVSLLEAELSKLAKAGYEGSEWADKLQKRLQTLKSTLSTGMTGTDILDQELIAGLNAAAEEETRLNTLLRTDLPRALSAAERSGLAFGASFDVIEEKLNATKNAITEFIVAGKAIPEELSRQFKELTFVKDIQTSVDSVLNSITDGFRTTLEGVMQGTQTFGEGMKNVFRNIMISITNTLTETFIMKPIKDFASGLVAKLSGQAGGAGAPEAVAAAALNGSATSLTTAATAHMTAAVALQGAAAAIVTAATGTGGLNDVLEDIASQPRASGMDAPGMLIEDAVLKAKSTAESGLMEFFEGIGGFFMTGLRSFKDLAYQGFMFLFNSLKSLFSSNDDSGGLGIFGTVLGALGTVASFFGGGPSNKQLNLDRFPSLDTGGVVTEPTLRVLSANSQPEAVIPLNSPMARKSGHEILNASGGKEGNNTNLKVHVEFLGDMVNPAEKGMTPEETIRVWVEDYNNGGPTRSIMRRDPALSTR